MQWRQPRPALLWIPVLLSVLGACSGIQSPPFMHGVSSSGLVEYSSAENAHHGGDNTKTLIWVGKDGAVWIQMNSVPKKACPQLKDSQLETLRRATRRALASGLKRVYATSVQPGPNANYSRLQTLELSIDQQRRHLRIKGWADIPAEVSTVLQQIGKIENSCGS